jgi:hypothetical protein
MASGLRIAPSAQSCEEVSMAKQHDDPGVSRRGFIQSVGAGAIGAAALGGAEAKAQPQHAPATPDQAP